MSHKGGAHDRIIKEMWPASSAVIGAYIGKSAAYVRVRAQRLGLTKKKAAVGGRKAERARVRNVPALVRREARKFMEWRRCQSMRSEQRFNW